MEGALTDETGTGLAVFATSPTLVTPTIGAATATSINGLTLTASTGTFTLTNLKTFSVSNTLTLAGTDGSTLNVGAGGTLGTAAFTAASAYEVPLTFSTGLTRTTNTITVNTSQNISTLSNLTSDGLIKTSGGTGALSIATAGTDYVVPATSLTSESVPFANGSGQLAQNNSNFFFQNSGTTPQTLATNTNVSLNVNTNGDTSGTDALNIYAQADAYLPNSAITNTLIGLNTDGATPGFTTSSSRGTGASPIQVQAGDLVGGFSSWGAEGASSPNYANVGGMFVYATGSSTNNLGGELDFYTKADGGSLAKTLSISNAGVVSIPNLSTNGIVATSGGTGALSVTTTTGSGSVALATSPAFTTPSLGAATATGLVTTSSNTTGNGLSAVMSTTANSITTGTVFSLASSATGITTAGANIGSFLDITESGAMTAFTGSLASINASGVNTVGSTGSALNINIAGTAQIMQGIILSDASTGALGTTAATSGAVLFKFSGAHTGYGFQVSDATATGTSEIHINNSLTTGTALAVSSSATGITTAGANVGSLFSLTESGAMTGMTGSLASINASGANAVGSTGSALNINVAGAAQIMHALNIADASTGALGTTAGTSGGILFNFSGAHTGYGMQISDATATGTVTVVNANALTSGIGMQLNSSSLTTGMLADIEVSGTAAAASQTGLNILSTGVSATSAITTYGAQISNTHSNATSGTNVALYLNASGATTANYGLIVNAGNVGIGTTTPTTLLYVGSGSVTTGTTVATFQNAGGTCSVVPSTSGGITCSSDMTLKKNITNLLDNSAWSFNTAISVQNQSVLNDVLALNPVDYNWNVEQNSDTKHAGFIAQEVQQVFPDLVPQDPATHLLSLNYSGLVPYTIEAIKEMNVNITSIDDLTKTNSWRDAIIAWLGDGKNGITSIFSKTVTANQVNTQELCIGPAGSQTCVTQQQLQDLLQKQNNNNNNVTTTPPVSIDSTQSTDVGVPTVADPVAPPVSDATPDTSIVDIPAVTQ